MNIALLVLRVIVGALFVGHGTQKLLGWFGGHGLAGTGTFFESLGLRPGRTMALGAGTAELAGGLLFGLGFLTPLAAMLIITVMAVAVATVHWQHGPWITDGGFEYNLVLSAVAFAVTAIGAGRYSLDHAFSLHVATLGWALAALAAGLLAALITLAVTRYEAHRHSPHPTATTA